MDRARRIRGPALTRVLPAAVILGWDKGVSSMQVGEKSLLRCESDYAYGSAGAGGGLIPGGATLTFEVELIEVEKKKRGGLFNKIVIFICLMMLM